MRSQADDTASPPITLRSALQGDAGRVAELCGELGYPSSEAAVSRRLAPLLGDRDHVVLVAVDGADRVIGWVHACVTRRVESEAFVEIGGMVVAAAHRGVGIGRRLLAAAEAWGGAQGVASIRVRSNVVRERAHRFYERAGYRRTKTSHVFEKVLHEP